MFRVSFRRESVQYEKLPQIFQTKKMWYQIAISLVLNWIVGPFVSSSSCFHSRLENDELIFFLFVQVMLAIAWATLPDLPTYRTGVIMVGLARCIAMVMVSFIHSSDDEIEKTRLTFSTRLRSFSSSDLEPPRWRRWRLLCRPGDHQLGPSNHPLLTDVAALRQRDRRRGESRAGLRKHRARCRDRSSFSLPSTSTCPSAKLFAILFNSLSTSESPS